MHILVRKIVVRNACSVPTSSRLRAVLMSWAVFGMRGPFMCPSAFKTAAEGAGDQRKAPLFHYVAVIRKKGTFAARRTFPQGPPECNVEPGLESQCTVALAPGACRASNTMSFILISLTLLSTALHVCEQAVNISSHCIIHLMQYLIHV